MTDRLDNRVEDYYEPWFQSSYDHWADNSQSIRIVQDTDDDEMWLQIVKKKERYEIRVDDEMRAWLVQTLLERPNSGPTK